MLTDGSLPISGQEEVTDMDEDQVVYSAERSLQFAQSAMMASGLSMK